MFAAAAHCSLCCRTTASDTASSKLRARSSLDKCSVPAPLGLPLLVGLDVVLEVNSCIERPVRLLRLVLKIDLCERQAHGLHLTVFAVVACHGGDDQVVHLEDEEVLLALARLPMSDRRVLQVHTRGARLQQHRRRLVDLVGKGKIVEACLALPAASCTPHA